MFLAIITLLSAISISTVSAYFSIVGLAAIFSASYWSVVIMASSIEFGKLVCAVWIKANWTNKLVPKLHKLYLVVALIICMLVTSLGVFGFLSKAHFEQRAPIQGDLIKIDSLQETIDLKKRQLDSLYKQLEELNKTILPGKRQYSLEQERRNMTKDVQTLTKEISELTSKKSQSKEVVSDVEIELGPIKYFASLIYEDPESNLDRAVQILIIMIMFVFDPLAVILLISAYISFQQVRNNINPKLQTKENVSINIMETMDNIKEIIQSEETPEEVIEEIKAVMPPKVFGFFKGLRVPKTQKDDKESL